MGFGELEIKSYKLKLSCMCFKLVIILFRPLPTFKSLASSRNLLVRYTFLMNFLICLKLLQASPDSIPWQMHHGLMYHSAVFICSVCHLFTSALSYYAKNPRDFLPADEASAVLKPHGTVRNKGESQSCRRKQANANITTSAKLKLRPVDWRK